MFDHIGLIVADADKALSFYESCLAPLELGVIQRHPNGAFIVAPTGSTAPYFLYVGPDAPEFWTDAHKPSRSPVHLCFSAPSRAAVDAFHSAAVNAAGTDNGKPGERDPGYYAAYVIDPDGNNIEAAHRSS